MLPVIGVRLHGGMAPKTCMQLSRVAELNGFASVWFAENPFDRGVLPTAAACAITTEQIKVGIGVFNPYNRHPTLIAMEMGALDELSNGRAMLGIGSGIGTAIERMGLSYAKPVGAVRDAIHIVRAMRSCPSDVGWIPSSWLSARTPATPSRRNGTRTVRRSLATVGNTVRNALV